MTRLLAAARARGLRVYYEPRSVVVHREGASCGTDVNAGHKRYQRINRAKFVERWRAVLDDHPDAPAAYDADTWHALAVRDGRERGDA